MESWKEPITPLIWLISGVILLLVFIGFIFLLVRAYVGRLKENAKREKALLLKHQMALLKNTVKSEEREKKRVALKLHDELLSQLHRVKLMNNDAAINEQLSQSILQIRRISHDLLPPLFEEVLFEELVHNFLVPFKKKYTISIQSNADPLTNLDIKLQLYRIFQELIINITKHANASKIMVNWRKTNHYCCLLIEDDGIGMNSDSKKGLGLKSIQSRTAVINGNYKYKSTKGKGTSTIILIPLNKENEDKNSIG